MEHVGIYFIVQIIILTNEEDYLQDFTRSKNYHRENLEMHHRKNPNVDRFKFDVVSHKVQG